MAKEKIQPFTSAKGFLAVQAAFSKAKGLLDANLKYFKKLYGEKGGKKKLDDGTLILTERKETDKNSVSYSPALEAVEELIRSGKIYSMEKEEACKWLLKNRKDHTKPQKTTQTIEVKLGKQAEVHEVELLILANHAVEELESLQLSLSKGRVHPALFILY